MPERNDPYTAINISDPPSWWQNKSARYTNVLGAARMRLPLTGPEARVLEWLIAQCLGTGMPPATGGSSQRGTAFIPRGQVAFFQPEIARDTGLERHVIGRALAVLAKAGIIEVLRQGHQAYREAAAERTLVRFEAEPSRWQLYDLIVLRAGHAAWIGRGLTVTRERHRQQEVDQ